MNNKLEKLDSKNYAKYDRTFMAFGSIMNSWQGIIGNNPLLAEGKTREAWNLAKELVSEFVDELYEKAEESAQTQEEQAL